METGQLETTQPQCRATIQEYWREILHDAASSCSTLDLLDTSRLTLDAPHPVWVAAGRDSINTKRAVIQMWLLLGVFNTQEKLFKMKKVKSAVCVLCQSNEIEDRVHFMLSCSTLADIRDDFLSKLRSISTVVDRYIEVSKYFLLCLLDPFSPLVPQELRDSWESEDAIYQISRNFCFAMHNKRTKIIEAVTQTT